MLGSKDERRQKDQFRWSMKVISNDIYEYFMEGRECHHKFLYKEMREEYKTNSIKHWTWPPCQKDCVWNNGLVTRTEEVRWKERRQPDVPSNSASLQRRKGRATEEDAATPDRFVSIQGFLESKEPSSFIHLLIRFVPTTCVVPLNVLCSK